MSYSWFRIIEPLYTGLIACFFLCLVSPPALADKLMHKLGEEPQKKEFNYIPFALYTQELEFGVGIGVGWTGQQQGQAGIYVQDSTQAITPILSS